MLMMDLVFGQHAVDHRDEDVVFLVQLQHKGAQSVHRLVAQFRHRVQRTHDRVNQPRGKVRQVQGLCQLFDRLQGRPMETNSDYHEKDHLV